MSRREKLLDKMKTIMTTTHAYQDYVFTIEYEPKAPAYIVDFPDIPNIITSGSTLPEAFAHACEALDLQPGEPSEARPRLARGPSSPGFGDGWLRVNGITGGP